MNNFDLRKYLVENKRTLNSDISEKKLINENEVTYKERPVAWDIRASKP